MRVDHVIYATEDLDAAAARFRDEFGLVVVAGGRHEGHGTQNMIAPLGGGYLELVSVADPQEAAGSDFGRGVRTRLERSGDGWLTWVIQVPDVNPVASRLGTPVITLRREGLSARLTGVTEAMDEPFLPFFMSRDPGVTDPGQGGNAGGITSIGLAGDVARLERWLDSTALPVRIEEGPPGIRAIGIGDRTIR